MVVTAMTGQENHTTVKLKLIDGIKTISIELNIKNAPKYNLININS